MKRGQAQLMWVLMEFILVIAASYGMDQLLDRARDDELSLQNYAAIETALTRQALDNHANSAVYYEQAIPGVQIKKEWPFSMAKGALTIGSAQVLYGYDKKVADGPVDKELLAVIPFSVSESRVQATIQSRVAMDELAIPCKASQIPKTFAILPTTSESTELTIQIIRQDSAKFYPATTLVQGLVESGDAVKDERRIIIENADATIIVARTSAKQQTVAYYNTLASGIACRVVNSIAPLQDAHLPSTYSIAAVPLIKQNLPVTHPAQELPDNKPAIFLVISTDQNALEVSKKLYEALV